MRFRPQRFFVCAVATMTLALVLGASRTAASEPNADAIPLATAANPMTLVLDARDAARGFLVAHLTLPVQPGEFTFVYPKWIPGYESPSGPLNDFADLRFNANGVRLAWQRDLVDMYAFHVTVPPGVASVQAHFNVLLNAPNDVMSDATEAIIQWNRALVYQQDTNAQTVFVRPSIILPAGWDFATALPLAQRNADRIDFGEVDLATLVDSPLACGRYSKHVALWNAGKASSALDIFADRPADFDVPNSLWSHYKRLVSEGLAMYGARHWNVYDFLLILSTPITGDGIEHHQSSDNRADEDFLTNPDRALTDGDALPHEYSHSWNGKYRRPAPLATPNFQVPMRTDLLWVYEGLNQYVGDVLSFRSGIRDAKAFPDLLASRYAKLDYEPGRQWDPLIDTTISAPYLYATSGDYSSLRRTTDDFYNEGEVLWLGVDTIIRSQTGGSKSLDDFLRAYAGPPDSPPKVVTYTRDDIEQLLNGIAPYDWDGFFQRYVYSVSEHPPSDEFERAGWKLVYTQTPNQVDAASERNDGSIDAWYSLGLNLDSDGTIKDVRYGSPAWKAGLAPGLTILAVNKEEFSEDVLARALRNAASSRDSINVMAKRNKWFSTYSLQYNGGVRYPHLVRIATRPDMFARIIAPRSR